MTLRLVTDADVKAAEIVDALEGYRMVLALAVRNGRITRTRADDLILARELTDSKRLAELGVLG